MQWEKIGVPSISTRLGYDTFLELVLVPWFVPSKLPPQGSRWSQQLPAGFEEAKQDLPASDRRQFAARIGTVYHGFDLGASFYNGYAFNPAARIDVQSMSNAKITPFYNSENVYAVSAAKNIGGYNIRAELGYFDQSGDDKFVQYVVGVDREWGNVLRAADSLYLMIQYVTENVTSRSGLNSVMPDFRRVFNNSVMWRSAYSFDPGKSWNLIIKGSYNLQDRDIFVEPAVGWRKNNTELEGGIDLFSGTANSFWGRYKDNDRIFIKAKFSY